MEDLPGHTHTYRKSIKVRLPDTLIEQVDQARKENKALNPEIFTYRNRFIETALKFVLRNLDALLFGENHDTK
jgi:metal-responsive CopG/Arc/MetJ family transcriptional regulator